MKVRLIKVDIEDVDYGHKVGDIFEAIKNSDETYDILPSGYTFYDWQVEELAPTDTHYNNENGSLYLFAEQHGLNAWEFDIIKRITRCRKKGQFIEDLEKTKRVIDLYIKEYDKERKD